MHVLLLDSSNNYFYMLAFLTPQSIIFSLVWIFQLEIFVSKNVYCHISPPLKELIWLPVKGCNKYIILFLTFKTFINLNFRYFSSLIKLLSAFPSSQKLIVRRFWYLLISLRWMIGDYFFCLCSLFQNLENPLNFGLRYILSLYLINTLKTYIANKYFKA